MNHLIDISNDQGDPDGEKNYPFGLSITLDEKTMAKLGLSCDCEPGDEIDLDVRAVVKNVNKSDHGHMVTLQITHLGQEDDPEEDYTTKPLPYPTMR